MSDEHTHLTAPTQFVEANGIRFAFRRFGKRSGVPIDLNHKLRGTLGLWNLSVTDGLAATREVIMFDNAGVSASSGETPSSFQKLGANVIAFMRALGLGEVDVLGLFSSMVAQEIALRRWLRQTGRASQRRTPATAMSRSACRRSMPSPHRAHRWRRRVPGLRCRPLDRRRNASYLWRLKSLNWRGPQRPPPATFHQTARTDP